MKAIPSRNGHETCTRNSPKSTADPTRPTNTLYIVAALSPIELKTALVVAVNVGMIYFAFVDNST